MHLTAPRRPADGLLEHDLSLDGVPGLFWTAGDAGPAPLVLLGHPGGLDRMYPRLLGRARSAVAAGFTAATIELPGSGDRPRSDDLEAARTDLRAAISAGRPVDAIAERLVLPLVERAVPEWRAALGALLERPDVTGPAGFTGGPTAIGLRLARVEPHLGAVVLFAGSVVPRVMDDEARRVTVPVHVMLQWDDAGNDRRRALEVFDTLGSAEKSLHANLGGHAGIPAHEGEAVVRFLERHLR